VSPSEQTGAAAVAERLAEREEVLGTFIESESDQLARACHEIARAFSLGATLLPFGTGPAATDAAHAAVEFMHPIIVGKRALPALAPSNDPTGFPSPWTLGRAGDIALVLGHGPPDPDLNSLLSEARRRGLMTLAMTAAGDDGLTAADFWFAVPSDDPLVVQEVQETAYHVLWELVHVFFEHPDLLDEACVTCGDVAVPATVVRSSGDLALVEACGRREEVATDLVGEVHPGEELLCHAGVAIERIAANEQAPEQDTDFLYPFLGGVGSDLDRVLAEVRASTAQKAQDTIALRRGIDIAAVEAAGREMRRSLERGGRLVAFGNGGSSTDARRRSPRWETTSASNWSSAAS
jgi:D-sedoheptulose 7-phosphate isomerase